MQKYYNIVSVLFVIAIVIGNWSIESTLTLEPSSISAMEQADGNHPRLFFTEEDIPLLRERAKTTHNEIWQPIIEYVDTIVSQSQSPPLIPPTTISDPHWRNFGNDLIALAFTCVITDEALYCNTALDYMLTMADWNIWGENGSRDLGLAHSLIGNALAYDWLYSYMTQEERVTVRNQLAQKAQEMYVASAGNRVAGWLNWWRTSYMQNHYWTNNNALGIVSLALANENLFSSNCRISTLEDVNLHEEPDPDSSIVSTMASDTLLNVIASRIGTDKDLWWQTDTSVWVNNQVVRMIGNCNNIGAGTDVWLTHASEQIAKGIFLLNGIEDGSWHESIHYQSYMLTMFLPFIANARELAGIDLYPHQYFRNYINWRIYNYIPDTPQPILSYGNFDPAWGAGYAPQNILRFMAAEYQNGHAEWMAQQLIATERIPAQERVPWYVFEFLYYDPSIEPVRPSANLPLAAHYPDLEGVIWRTGWDNESLVFGLKTGPYGGQFAFNTFLQASYPWDKSCEDTGCELNVGHNHEDTNTFYLVQGNTWLIPEGKYYTQNKTKFHNTILIDNEGQHRPPSNNGGWRDPATFEGATGVVKFLTNTPNFDYIASAAATRYPDMNLEALTRHVLFVRPNYFIMIDQIAAEDTHDYLWQSYLGGPVTIEDNWIRSDAENDQVMGIAVLAPIAHSIETGTDELPYVSVRPSTPQDNVRLIHALYPTDQAGWEQRPNFTVLTNSPVRTVIEADRTETDGLIDHIFIQYNPTSGFELGEHYGFDGNVAVVSRDEEGNLVRILIVGGTHLSEADVLDASYLIEKNASESPLQINLEDETAFVFGDYVGTVSLHAPSVETVMKGASNLEFERDGEYINFEINAEQ